MSVTDILDTAQAYLLGSGDVLQMEGSVAEMIAQLAKTCPVFGNVGVLYNTWMVGLYTDAVHSYYDMTAAAHDEGLDFPVGTSTVNDGLLLGASAMFDTAVFTIVVPSFGGAPVYEWTYWNGWHWAPLYARTQPNFAAPGLQQLTFEPPADWQMSTPTDLYIPPEVAPDQFWVRLRATTPPPVPAQASTLNLLVRFFQLPERILQLLSVHFFPRELEPMGVSWAQDALDPGWRRRVGTPIRYTQEIATSRRLRLFPSPAQQGPQGIPPFQGIPGAMVPTNHLVTFFLEAPAVVDLSPWFEDLVAYLLTSWEASREGERQDLQMAQAMAQLTALIVALLKELYHQTGEEMVKDTWEIPVRQNLVQGS